MLFLFCVSSRTTDSSFFLLLFNFSMYQNCILRLNEAGINDIALVGGKNASLGEMLRHLTPLGVNVPDGFIISVEGYRAFIEANHLDDAIRLIVSGIEENNLESLRRAGLTVRQLIRNARFPQEISKDIIEAYYTLSKKYGQEMTDVAVRSSATAEDLPDA